MTYIVAFNIHSFIFIYGNCFVLKKWSFTVTLVQVNYLLLAYTELWLLEVHFLPYFSAKPRTKHFTFFRHIENYYNTWCKTSSNRRIEFNSVGRILVPRASRPHASSLGPGTHRTGTARKLALISNAHGN